MRVCQCVSEKERERERDATCVGAGLESSLEDLSDIKATVM